MKTPYEGVPVGTIKKHATGKGNSGKSKMIAAATGILIRVNGSDSPAIVRDDNEADAICLLDYAVGIHGTEVRA